MMLVGTTSPTSVTHCVNVFGKKSGTTTTTTAAEKLMGAMHELFFENMQSYMEDRQDAAALE